MNARAQETLRLDLEDILGNLQFARRTGDLGRLAVLTYWEVRRWARMAHEDHLAAHASELITERPHASRTEFLDAVDGVIAELESIRTRVAPPSGCPQ